MFRLRSSLASSCISRSLEIQIGRHKKGSNEAGIQFPGAFLCHHDHHSHSTPQSLNRMLNILVSDEVYSIYVKLPTGNVPPSRVIEDNLSFHPFFKNCLGALDGSHVPTFVPECLRPAYRNQKARSLRMFLQPVTLT